MNFWNFFSIYVFEVKESISDIPTELPCSSDQKNLGQLPVQEALMILLSNVWNFSTFYVFEVKDYYFRMLAQSYTPNLYTLPLHHNFFIILSPLFFATVSIPICFEPRIHPPVEWEHIDSIADIFLLRYLVWATSKSGSMSGSRGFRDHPNKVVQLECQQ